MFDLTFYKGKRVFVTGHTGFKGSWICMLLKMAGAYVRGYALEPQSDISLYKLANIEKGMDSLIRDIRDLNQLVDAVSQFEPEIIIHLAAQPLVRESYDNPAYTYETNIMGTVNILESVRLTGSVKSFVNVTTDKVYKNKEWVWGYRESEELNGHDPYSNSKSCSDIITDSYRNSFFSDYKVALSTARAGNVIGGGDFAKDRIIPDCIRAAEKKKPIILRNPNSVRPYQHVLEPVVAYLMLAKKQYEDPRGFSGSYNIGPEESDCVSTGKLANIFREEWGDDITVIAKTTQNSHHEANFLKLDNSKIKETLDWKPRWTVNTAVKKTVEWSKCKLDGRNLEKCMEMQIMEYMEVEL